MGILAHDSVQQRAVNLLIYDHVGEFGRTPNINGNQGRDHWARGFSVVLSGGAIRNRGFAYGSTGPNGMACIRPIGIKKLFATIYKAAGIDYSKHYVTEGRKIKYATNATPIKELF